MSSPRVPFWLLVVCLALPGGGRALAAPSNVRLSFTDTAPSTSMGVTWTTLSGTAEATVRYGTAKGTYPLSATGKTTQISTTLGTISEVQLTGLSPSTTYYYQAGGTQGGYSQEYSFSTAPAPSAQCGKSRLAIIGDSRAESWEGDKGASNTWVTLIKTAAAQSPDFFWHGGDIIYDGSQEKQWANHLKVTSVVSPYFPILYTLGNHDNGPGEGDGANFNKVLYLPRAAKTLGGSGTEDYYHFTHGNAIFVSLSTESFSGGSIKFKDQADWMDKVLTQNPKRWRFVTVHRPIYTEYIFINHKPDEAGHNAALVPVFNKHHVDIVFQSHNHFYERFVPSNCSSASSTKPCPVSSFDKGTVYITTGGGGAFLLPLVGLTSSVRPVASFGYHYVMLDINNHTLSLKAVNQQGKNIDTLIITKTAPSPDPCAATAADSSLKDGRPLDQGLSPKDGPQADKAASAADLDGAGKDISQNPSTGGSSGCDCALNVADAWSPGLSLLLLAGLLVLGWWMIRRRR